MKYISILCLSIALLSMYTAELPQQNRTLEQEIEFQANTIRGLYDQLDTTRFKLSRMKIWMINKDGSIELHCGKFSDKPIYTIFNIYDIDEKALIKAIMQCFENNKFNPAEEKIATNLIIRYINLRREIEIMEENLAILRKNLARYKKPLEHPNT